MDPEEFAKNYCLTPTALDYLANYEDAVQPMKFQLDADATNLKPFVHFPGNTEADPAASALAGVRPASYTSYPNNVLAYDMNRPAGTSYYHKLRGSWKLMSIFALTGSAERSAPDTDVYVRFEVNEPLLLSPSVFGSGYGKQGFSTGCR